MFWDKKDGKGLPELPSIRSPFANEVINNKFGKDKEEETYYGEVHALPSFPDSPIRSGFSQSAIKDAIENSEESEEMIPSFKTEKNFSTIEMEEPTSNKNSIMSLGSKNNGALILPSPPTIVKNENVPILPSNFDAPIMSINSARKIEKDNKDSDVFIKIEKFYSVKRMLMTTKEQIEQIDELLKKIRETKLKEEQELANWEREISLVRSRIQNVMETIFEKT